MRYRLFHEEVVETPAQQVQALSLAREADAMIFVDVLRTLGPTQQRLLALVQQFPLLFDGFFIANRQVTLALIDEVSPHSIELFARLDVDLSNIAM